MSGTTLASGDLDPRRRRILYRAWHRGTREMDLLLGRFADAVLPSLDADGLDALETLMEVPDTELYGWIAGRALVPANHDTAMYRRLVAFHADGPPEGRP